ncbi:MAG: hypothetical protein C3F12_11435 [Candidatus Methylomirabilota bacterium]|nr:hypothetical protein [Candidatus Methylomirabilis sp.]NJD68093.1 hypothetical protein [candidate division NC10 bacterium]PWB44305.1 MAG: hypothetical protein C3F12_11435 [candidate division NC10 bacterium]
MEKILAALTLCALAAGCVTPPTWDQLAAADYGSYPSDYEQIIKGYMQFVLKDPESARFQFLNTPKSGWRSFGEIKFGYVVCAHINAKNSYGGYVGNRMSYFMLKNGRVIDAVHGSEQYGEAVVSNLCKNFIGSST